MLLLLKKIIWTPPPCVFLVVKGGGRVACTTTVPFQLDPSDIVARVFQRVYLRVPSMIGALAASAIIVVGRHWTWCLRRA